jgi:hypothetical protein
MTFKELVMKSIGEHGYEKIVDRLCEIYDDEKDNYDGHVETLKKLEGMEPAPITEECYKGMEIEITHVIQDWKDPELGIEEYDDVHGKNGKTRAEASPDIQALKDCHEEECWGLDFTPWAEWLGMPIRQVTFDNYSELDAMAHCLWEISWMGFDEKTIKAKREDLDARYQAVKDGDVELIPWEDVKKELDEKIEKWKKEKE